MMGYSFFENVLQLNGLGFAYLDAEFKVRSPGKTFAEFFGAKISPEGLSVFNLFPETVGLEAVLNDIAAGKQACFRLEEINRGEKDDEFSYFNLSFYMTSLDKRPLICIVENISHTARLEQQLRQQQNEIRMLESALNSDSLNPVGRILGNSEPVIRLRAMIERMASIPNVTVLLQGESGTGKSMVARVVHHLSSAQEAPFIEINCAAIPETLLESELFGYEKGAFTNALSSKKGLLEEANQGTLFLDEIGELPIKLQAKLLSFLETKRFRRLGSTVEHEVQTRLIAATNRDLSGMVSSGDFREDLFYRLNVVRVELPALKELDEDIILIADNFIKKFSLDFKKRVNGLTDVAKAKLRGYEWPGNVRELRNAIERAMIFSDEDMIDAPSLHLGNSRGVEQAFDPLQKFRLPAEGIPFLEIERKLLQDALALSEGNQSRAAKLLHLSRDAFRYRLEKHDLL